MKNWQPISLTSVLHKMATNVNACRLKKVVQVLISKSLKLVSLSGDLLGRAPDLFMML